MTTTIYCRPRTFPVHVIYRLDRETNTKLYTIIFSYSSVCSICVHVYTFIFHRYILTRRNSSEKDEGTSKTNSSDGPHRKHANVKQWRSPQSDQLLYSICDVGVDLMSYLHSSSRVGVPRQYMRASFLALNASQPPFRSGVQYNGQVVS